MKGINPNTVVHRTQALHGLFDGLVGLSRLGRKKSRAGFCGAFLLAMIRHRRGIARMKSNLPHSVAQNF